MTHDNSAPYAFANIKVAGNCDTTSNSYSNTKYQLCNLKNNTAYTETFNSRKQIP